MSHWTSCLLPSYWHTVATDDYISVYNKEISNVIYYFHIYHNHYNISFLKIIQHLKYSIYWIMWYFTYWKINIRTKELKTRKLLMNCWGIKSLFSKHWGEGGSRKWSNKFKQVFLILTWLIFVQPVQDDFNLAKCSNNNCYNTLPSIHHFFFPWKKKILLYSWQSCIWLFSMGLILNFLFKISDNSQWPQTYLFFSF